MMNKLAPIIEWFKANPMLVFCVAIILISIGSFYYPTHVQASRFQEEVEARQQVSQKIQGFFQTPADLPPEEADGPPRKIQMVINDKAIEKITDVYQKLGKEADDIFKYAVDHNRYGHQVLLDKLFPKPEDMDDQPYQARIEYLKSFPVLSKYLAAGSPPSEEDKAELFRRDEEEYKRSLLIDVATALTEEQKADLTRKSAKKLVALYQSTARKFHLYADPVMLGGAYWQPGPFQVMEWGREPDRPLMWDLWEGQMQLWIQQDICRAIAIANKVDDPEASVVNLPVKHLLSIQVNPVYIGVNKPTSGTNPVTTVAPLTDAAVKDELNKRLLDNFPVSPTGRCANPLYDVRQAKLSVIVSSKHLPELLNAIGQVNFMTVIGMDMHDVDEFAALRNGYWYGTGDVVHVELTIESIWLRQWTAGHISKEAVGKDETLNPGLMPDETRVYLGMKPWAGPDYVPMEIQLKRKEAARAAALPAR
jgi:hypothetical protein